MERRKFVIGLGALAAGGSAAIGSGAFTSASTGDRSVEVNVASDSSAFLQIYPSEGPNGNYAEENGDGELELNFDEDATGQFTGDGVNPGSEYTFDDVFRINNAGTQEVDVWVEHDIDGVSFYFGGDPDQSIEFDDWDGLFDDPESLNASAGGLEIGVEIIADDLDTEDLGDVEGSVTVAAGPAGGDSEVRSQD